MTEIVSVVMPVFNGGNELKEAIESVLKQTHKKLELIIINDGSVDATVHILSNYVGKDPRVKVINLGTSSGGPAKPRNIGVNFSLGDYIAFIDHDDLWHESKIAIQLQEMKNFNVPFISCEKINFKDTLSFQDSQESFLHSINHSKITLYNLLNNNLIVTSSVLIDKKIISDQKFKEDSRYVAVEDYIMWCGLHKTFPFSIKIENPLVGYRISKNSISKNKIKMIFRRWAALEIIVGPNFLVRFKLIALYIFTYFKKTYLR